MKLIIDIPKEVVAAIQNGEDYRYDIHTAIAQGVPCEERPQGKWLIKRFNSKYSSCECSECRNDLGQYFSGMFADGQYSFCDRCGAKMEIEIDNETDN